MSGISNNEERRPARWILLAILIKLPLFLIFAYNFLQNWPGHLIVNSIFIESGDTSGYYLPIESFVNGQGYDTFCRMPGLLPIYAPLYFIFGGVWGKTLIILLQFITGAVSVYFLARSAEMIFKNKTVFLFTFFLYAISSFVSVWDNYGLSDSFSTSFLVFSIYFFVSYNGGKKNYYLVWSGLFLTWSIFFRPINGMIYATMLLIMLLQNKDGMRNFVKGAFLFVLPCVLAISMWTLNNYVNYKRLIYLQGSFSECYGTALTEEHLAIRELIIGWGGDFQEWSVGTEAEWFFSRKRDYRSWKPFTPDQFTHYFNLDSLRWLKVRYDSLRAKDPLPPETAQHIKEDMIAATHRFVDSYKNEHPYRFYIGSRLRFIKRFVFPTQLDDLPFPPFSRMSFYHKIMKFGYLLLLNVVNLMALIGVLIAFRRKNWYGIIPVVIIVLVAGVLGFVEQRYLVPAYPLLVVYCAFTLTLLKERILRKKSIA